MLRKCLGGLLVLALLVCSAAVDAQPQDKTKEGPEMLTGQVAPDVAPEFAFNGDKARLEDLKGKVVLIDFWAVWCGPCRAVFPELTRLHKTYNKQGLEVVGLTTYYKNYDFQEEKLVRTKDALTPEQEQEMLKRFAAHYKLPYRIQVVPRADFTKYKIRGIPTAVLVDREGKVAMVKVGSGPANAKALEAKVKELLASK